MDNKKKNLFENKKVMVKPIRRKGGWLFAMTKNENHSGNFMFDDTEMELDVMINKATDKLKDPLVDYSDEAKAKMELVRNARQHKKKIPLSPVLKDTNVELDEIELPKDKFMLLLNIIMELQRDIDYLIDAHRKMKD